MRAWIWVSLGAVTLGCTPAPVEPVTVNPADAVIDAPAEPDATASQGTDADSDGPASDHSDETDGVSDDTDAQETDAAPGDASVSAPNTSPDSAKPETAAAVEVVEPMQEGGADDDTQPEGVADSTAADAGAPDVVAPADVAPPANAGPRTYALTTKGGFVGVVVRYDRSALIAGHDHVLVATRYSGSVTWDPNDLSACKVSVTVPVASLVVDPPGSRKRQGFEGETSAKDKAGIKKNALGKNQLNGSAHPNITFRSTSCAPDGDRVLVKGNLTLRGVTKAVRTRMKISADEQGFQARGSVGFSHTQFGFKPFTAALGALKNDDKLTLDLSFKGNP